MHAVTGEMNDDELREPTASQSAKKCVIFPTIHHFSLLSLFMDFKFYRCFHLGDV
jgi:hypothetical protein